MNPFGAPIFVVTTVMMACAMLVFLNHLRLDFEANYLTRVMEAASWIGCVGFACVAIFADGSRSPFDWIHGKAAIFAFGGLAVALATCTRLFALHSERDKGTSHTLAATLLLMSIKFLALIAFLDKGPMMQWIGFMAIFTWFHIVVVAIPDRAGTGLSQG